MAKYAEQYPVEAADLQSRIRGELPADWRSYIPTNLHSTPTSSLKASDLVSSALVPYIQSMLMGTADLTPSCNVTFPGSQDFQQPDLTPTSGSLPVSYSGRCIHYGIREHAMAAISNGIAAFNPAGTFIPITSTFLVFHLYAAAAVRMGALQRLQCIHIATHDSIGVGENGPTHQPVEIAALYRAMPNILYIRPCDNTEVVGAWEVAITNRSTPSVISLSRQELVQYPWQTSREGVEKGAYIFQEGKKTHLEKLADITIIGVGSEMKYAVEAASVLEGRGILTRIVSFPCQRLFEQQCREYKRGVLRRHEGIPAVLDEAYMSNGWERYADAAVCMKGFGRSMPGDELYKYFGFDRESIANRILAFLKRFNGNGEE